jgi:hypothetical protein
MSDVEDGRGELDGDFRLLGFWAGGGYCVVFG